MITYWLGMNPVIVGQALVLLAACSTLLFLVTDGYLRCLIKAHWKFICLAVVLVVLWRYPFSRNAFYGLEYEDSYVYTVAARTDTPQQEHTPLGSAYLTSTCVVGSVESCEASETYSGHFIGWPSIIRITARIFPFGPLLPIYLNIFGSCIAVVAVFLTCLLMTDSAAIGVASAFIFATTPAFAVYGTATYAEPASNSCIAVVLLCFVRYIFEKRPDRPLVQLSLNWVAFVLTALLAVLIKRENLMLALALLLTSVTYMVFYRPGTLVAGRKRLSWAILGSILVIVLSSIEFAPAKTLVSETHEFGVFPFSPSNFYTLAPIYLRAFVSPRWYSCSFLFVIFGLWAAIREKTAIILVSCLFLCYFLLYTSHVESYYQIHSGSVFPYQTLRFSMSLMTFWSILGGAGLVELGKHLQVVSGNKRMLVAAFTVMYGAACFISTVNLREDAHSHEFAARIGPALTAARFAARADATPTYVVTLEPLVLQMFAPEPVKVLGLNSIDGPLLQRLRGGLPETNILYLRQSQYSNDIADERYARALGCLNSLPQQVLYTGSDYSVITVTLPPGTKATSAFTPCS
jgi:hypothetical protein